ncbi:uncharacterized protein LOC135847651 [Planococcus citri]|uniref:uncharacterized protein LOC135847651 n=1 Tax=Planococcus citri TaxID=170843 RepID=UPI0031F74DE4
MNLVHYFVTLNTIMLIIPIRTETPSIHALLSKKWKISKTLAMCYERIKVQKALQLSPQLQKEFCSYLVELNLDHRLPTVSKKTSESLCHCDFVDEIKDLGADYNPRYIPQRKCIKKECCDRGFCREVVYTMRVLKLKNSDIQENKSVTSSLNHCFNFGVVNITIACQCS